jgi:hypothetical protein
MSKFVLRGSASLGIEEKLDGRCGCQIGTSRAVKDRHAPFPRKEKSDWYIIVTSISAHSCRMMRSARFSTPNVSSGPILLHKDLSKAHRFQYERANSRANHAPDPPSSRECRFLAGRYFFQRKQYPRCRNFTDGRDIFSEHDKINRMLPCYHGTCQERCERYPVQGSNL